MPKEAENPVKLTHYTGRGPSSDTLTLNENSNFPINSTWMQSGSSGGGGVRCLPTSCHGSLWDEEDPLSLPPLSGSQLPQTALPDHLRQLTHATTQRILVYSNTLTEKRRHASEKFGYNVTSDNCASDQVPQAS